MKNSIARMKKTILSFMVVSSLFTNLTNTFAQSIPNFVPQNGLVGYWPFENNANDITGNNYHGTEINVLPTTDRFGNANAAYEFNGIDSRVEVNHNMFNVSWNNYSISLWLNTYSKNNINNYNDSQCLINTDEHNGVGIALHGDKNPFNTNYTDKYTLGIGSNPNIRDWDLIGKVSPESNALFTINQWHHYVLVKKDIYTFYLYIDGQLDKTYTTTLNSQNFLTNLVFGSTAKSISYPEVFIGKLDDYGVWDRALEPSEISSLYNGITASIQDNSNRKEITISPNPTNDIIILHNLDNSIGNYSYQINDLNGKIIAKKQLSGTTISLKSMVDTGLYFITLFKENEEVVLKTKMIVN